MPKSTEVLPECTQLKDPGKLRPFLEAFTSRLLNLGHTRLTVSGYEASARHFGQWLQSTKIAITEIDDDVVRRFAQHRRIGLETRACAERNAHADKGRITGATN
ncbi:hypothetical protein [Rhizobium leguminosarum]